MNNNTPHTEHFEELCSAYVLNALDTEEQQEFEKMLHDAEEEQLQFFHELHAAANQLAFTVERAKPSAAVKDQLMNRIQSDADGAATSPKAAVTDDQSSGFSRSALAMAASFALLLITLALVFYSFNLYSEINNKEDMIAERDATITELKNEVQQKEELLSILEARSVDLVVMAGLDVNPNGYGKVIWDPEKKQALLQVSNLPEVPEGKDYQLWLIKNNKPTSAGVFAVNTTGQGSFFKVEQLVQADQQSANAFAITLEPKGGSQQPTGDMYMLGNISQQTN